MKETTFNGYQYFADPRYFTLNEQEYDRMFGDGDASGSLLEKQDKPEDHTVYSDEFWAPENFTYGNFEGTYFADPRYFVLNQEEYKKIVDGKEPEPPVPPVPPTPSVMMYYHTTDDVNPIDNNFTRSASRNEWDEEKGAFVLEWEEPLTSIGAGAFSGSTELYSIEIPDTFKSIGDYAFENCSGLASIVIPSNVKTIGDGVFCGCSSLSSITVETGNSVYDSRNNCDAIIETATNKLLYGCKNTAISNTIASIGNGAFKGCSELTSITIPNTITSIGDYAFINCVGLESITCDATSPSSLGTSAFDNTNNCPIYVPEESVNTYKTNWSQYSDRIKYSASLSDYAKQTIRESFGVDGETVLASAIEYCNNNPDVVKYVNEDPLVICSLDLKPKNMANEMPYRWLNNYSAQTFINIELIPTTASTLDVIFKANSYNGTGSYMYPYVFGAETEDKLTSRVGLWFNATQLAPRIGSWKTNITIDHIGKANRIEWREDRKGYLNGDYVQDAVLPSAIPSTMRLFAMNCVDKPVLWDGSQSDSCINRFVLDNNLFVPWKYVEGGVVTNTNIFPVTNNTCGVLNLTTGKFFVADSAWSRFKIEYTDKNGTPWNP